MRGIVVSPEIYISDKNRMVIKNSGIDPIKLRQYLLYWDKIDFPDNNIISFGSSPEVKYLMEVDALQRSEVRLNLSGDMVDLYLKSQMEAFKENNNVEKGSWSIAQPQRKLILDEGSSIQTRSLEIELYDCLPIPSSIVSLEDILIFKQRRNDELLEFRYLMDSLYQDVETSFDIERQFRKTIEQLQSKIVDIHRVMDESKITRLKASISVNLDLNAAVIGGLKGFLAGKYFSFPTEWGAIIGAASSVIKFNAPLTLKPKQTPNELRDFAYLYFAHKELE